MKKELEIKVPTDWSAISLKRYLYMQKDMELYGEEENGQAAVLLHHLCGVEPTLISQLPIDIIENIKKDLSGFMGETNLPLKRIIKVDGKEYGFEPNLSNMSYGAYLDITRWEQITIDKNWAKIMAVLYRPIKSKTLDFYEIEPYDAEKANPFIWENVSMDIHFGALFFFVHTLTDLLNDILSSLEKETELPPNIKSILGRNGKVIRQLFNLQKTISPASMLSLKSH